MRLVAGTHSRRGQARVVSFGPVGGGHDAPFERGVAFVHDAQMLRHVRPTGDEVVDLVCASARYSRPITWGPWLALRSTVAFNVRKLSG